MTLLATALVIWVLLNAAFVAMRFYATRARGEAAQIVYFVPRARLKT